MNTSRYLFAVLICLYCSAWSHGKELYALNGACENATAGLSGHLKMFILEDEGNLTGMSSVTGWLTGGGHLRGRKNGDTFRFTSQAQNGLMIDWEGTLSDGVLSGEYYVKPQSGLPKEVGEWITKVSARLKTGQQGDGDIVMECLKMTVESQLNNPVKRSDGTLISGAQSIFEKIHPAGKGVSICVESAEIDWKPESKARSLDDIHKYRVTYVLYWTGIITPTGWTRLKLSYNNKIQAITSHEIVESTGTTNTQVENAVFDLGFVLGAAAVESLFNSK